MRSNAEYARAMRLVNAGLNDCAIGRATGVPRRTILDWRGGATRERRRNARNDCPRCGHPGHDFNELPGADYAYLLGMYLGDGHISRYARAWRLRISLDLNWPDVILECANAARAVLPANKVSIYQPDAKSNCAVVSTYSAQLVCLFPQHGPGLKHHRPIELVAWQEKVVRKHPQPFLRGLIHSDGCRFLNRVTVGGKTYVYPRYTFSNASDEIRDLFTDACDQLGIDWRRMNARNISVARRESVAQLDEFVGPKS